jgi:hypothetical protein
MGLLATLHDGILDRNVPRQGINIDSAGDLECLLLLFIIRYIIGLLVRLVLESLHRGYSTSHECADANQEKEQK